MYTPTLRINENRNSIEKLKRKKLNLIYHDKDVNFKMKMNY